MTVRELIKALNELPDERCGIVVALGGSDVGIMDITAKPAHYTIALVPIESDFLEVIPEIVEYYELGHI